MGMLIAIGLVLVVGGVVVLGVALLGAAISLIGTLSSAIIVVLAVWLAIIVARKIYEAHYSRK